ncbi:hypothetical protein SPSYN_01147 [Sporotomaculum syntrophicum]|uniref:Uncharacterized protein n=1 Tax=Sporotomaculum syntrophicum TaxID=182264 RepID=A0A9D2WQD9_9FIRM|nr:hypothetical protein [Sporotomaculum syntrophicum]KAF1085011.1 hypothetical protein SPSYN_01147 [Sporotomaculum syntrophicum]
MEYIAIDMTGLNISAQDKTTILDYFKKCKVTVIEASFDDLKQKGLFDEKSLTLDGILLSIKKLILKQVLNSGGDSTPPEF